MARYSKTQVEEATAELRRICPPGTAVYTVLRHVSRSGMLRKIKLHIVRKGVVIGIGWYAARILRAPIDGDHAVTVTGCGMDMGFHAVNALSYALHGYRPKGDGAASEAAGGRLKPRRGHYRAGYSLIHRWL
jgi:hypothetical protein